MKSLFKKINLVMKDVEYLSKDDIVGYKNNSYKAISEEKVTSIVRTSLINHGLVIIPTKVDKSTRLERWQEEGKHKQQVFTEVNTTYIIACTDTGEQIEIQSAGHGVDSQDKSIGKAITYAYKYLLLRTFAIPTGEDPDKIHSDGIEVPQDIKALILDEVSKCIDMKELTSVWNKYPQHQNTQWFKHAAGVKRQEIESK